MSFLTEDAHAGTAGTCQICPVCGLLRTLGDAQPEVVEHLTTATRELALALRATLDAHLDGREPTGGRAGGERLERIRID